MDVGIDFFLKNILLGIGLAMDAFSVSVANGLNDCCMKTRKMCGIAGIFGIFQGIMPLIGWVCIHTIAMYFSAFEKIIPWIALVLLGFIGGKMLYESIKQKNMPMHQQCLLPGALVVQGIATSIDALSVGFTISSYGLAEAVLAAVIIALVTYIICMFGLFFGKKIGVKIANKAGICGGIILIFIGVEIFISSFF